MSQEKDDGLPQDRLELESIRALIQDLTKATILWLSGKASEQERVYVREIQGRLADLDGIISRRMQHRSSAQDGEDWPRTVRDVLSLLAKATAVRGNIVGESWARLRKIAEPSASGVESKPTQKQDNGVQQSELTPKSWQELEIAFLSDKRVEICSGGIRETYNYDELGFADRRNGIPNRAWTMLCEIARKNGTIQLPRPLPGTGKGRA